MAQPPRDEEDYSDLLESLKPPPPPQRPPAPIPRQRSSPPYLMLGLVLVAILGAWNSLRPRPPEPASPVAASLAVATGSDPRFGNSGPFSSPAKALGMARSANTRARFHMLKSGLEAYAMEHDGYPTTQQGLKVLVGGEGRGDGGYVPPEAITDTYGNPLAYACEGGHFRITSLGADGRPGGEGNDADETFDSAQAGAGALSPPTPLPETGRVGAQ